MGREPFVEDEGFYFGIGAFETIAVEQGIPQLLEEHIQRIRYSLDYFGIEATTSELLSLVIDALESPESRHGRRALKLAVSPQNKVVSMRENPYVVEDYIRGFACDIAEVRRNETSPFTFHKTLNYGENIFEKKKAKKRGVDEPLFLNTKGFLSEGATTNVFIVQGNSILTPSLKSGLLPGIMREYVCRIAKVEQREISYEEVFRSDEMFLTNSLLDIMPVCRLGDRTFRSMKTGQELHEAYMSRLRR